MVEHTFDNKTKTMTITFCIEYKTQWGEELYLMLNNAPTGALVMRYNPGALWTVSLHVSDDTRQLRYRYMVKCGGQITRVEQCPCHMLAIPEGVKSLTVSDFWDDEDATATDDFIASLVELERTKHHLAAAPGQIVIEASVPERTARWTAAVVGQAPALGAWNIRSAIPMKPCGNGMWRAVLDIPAEQLPTPYKLILKNKHHGVEWEEGENRCLPLAPAAGDMLLVPNLRFRTSNMDNKMGTIVDLTALRSDRDMGCGDLGDLKKLIRWTASTGQDVLSLNAIADNSVVEGWLPEDVRQRVVTRAIDMACIDLSAVGTITDRATRVRFQRQGMALNQEGNTDLEAVRQFKQDYCRCLFEQGKNPMTRTAAFRRFVAANADWLHPYAAQAMLKRVVGSADSSTWGNYARYDGMQVAKFLKARHREATFFFYIQYLLYQQLVEAATYARTKHLALTCDMVPRHDRLLPPREPWVNERCIRQRFGQHPGATVLIPLHDWLLVNGEFLPRMSRSTDQRLPVSIEELTAATPFYTRLISTIKHQGQ